eukprot:TRINITY_DN11812_c0_g1_i1.p1 TRINITY_DN11812_c0_g1~~TRINITY_DN11812_c0_g1_i1.p1  ORF type:complete len:223 (-),score=-25.97 TRINITY_DN11812_c0_g1_i1:708-1295(-)
MLLNLCKNLKILLWFQIFVFQHPLDNYTRINMLVLQQTQQQLQQLIHTCIHTYIILLFLDQLRFSNTCLFVHTRTQLIFIQQYVQQKLNTCCLCICMHYMHYFIDQDFDLIVVVVNSSRVNIIQGRWYYSCAMQGLMYLQRCIFHSFFFFKYSFLFYFIYINIFNILQYIHTYIFIVFFFFGFCAPFYFRSYIML